MLLVGDVHSLFYDYKRKVQNSGVKTSLQLGDFGLGFPNGLDHVDMSDVEGIHLFIRGNHDNPSVCRVDKCYAGDYGVLEGSFIDGFFDKLFFISGAWSIDREWRIENVSWWSDEQLSYEELSKAIDKYEDVKPEIICAHECPTFVLHRLYSSNFIPSRTSQALEQMINIHKPSYFFFAHHHFSWRKEINGCWYICLDELETLDISKRVINNLNLL